MLFAKPGDYSRGEFRVKLIRWAHNDYLQLIAEHGIIGAALFFSWLVLITSRAIRTIRRQKGKMRTLAVTLLVSTLGLGIDAFFSIDWYATVPAAFLMTLWGCIEKLDHDFV